LAMASGIDGDLWAGSCCDDSSFVNLTPSGVTTDFAATFIEGVEHAVRGPDGATWATGKHGLLRYGAGGILDDTPIDTNNFGDAITVGPDGYLWFTEDSPTLTIGTLGAGGTVKLFAVPPIGSSTLLPGLTSGPDGALWFTEDVRIPKMVPSCIIGRITTGGLITSYSIPIPHCEPGGIVTAADGNLWFADKFNKQIDIFSP